MIKVVLADDHKIMLEGIANLLSQEEDIDIVATCANGNEVLEFLKTNDADLVLLDLDMPELNGMQCAEIIKKTDPELPVAILTMHQEKALIEKFISMGINGYLLKTTDKDELAQAIRSMAAGRDYFPSEITKILVAPSKEQLDVTQSPLLDNLTRREFEIIKQVASGATNKEIAADFNISPRTVDTHRTNLMTKLGLKNVADLVRFAFQNKLIK
jgi:two-component system response regulator NreC